MCISGVGHIAIRLTEVTHYEKYYQGRKWFHLFKLKVWIDEKLSKTQTAELSN